MWCVLLLEQSCQLRLWIARVPTHSNPADGSSRLDASSVEDVLVSDVLWEVSFASRQCGRALECPKDERLYPRFVFEMFHVAIYLPSVFIVIDRISHTYSILETCGGLHEASDL